MSDGDVDCAFVLAILGGVCGGSRETMVQAAAAVRGRCVAKVSRSGSGVRVQEGGT